MTTVDKDDRQTLHDVIEHFQTAVTKPSVARATLQDHLLG